jgi:hypothetical protein
MRCFVNKTKGGKLNGIQEQKKELPIVPDH